MRYFRLTDDLSIPGRWHLGEVTYADGSEPMLREGLRLEYSAPLEVELQEPGRILDFSLTSFAVPVARTALANAIAGLAGADVQCIPLHIVGAPGMLALNALRLIRCVDESRSKFVKWTAADHRSDLAGQYRSISRLVLDAQRVPRDAHLFRITDDYVTLVGSEELKNVMESVGCVGARFQELPT